MLNTYGVVDVLNPNLLRSQVLLLPVEWRELRLGRLLQMVLMMSMVGFVQQLQLQPQLALLELLVGGQRVSERLNLRCREAFPMLSITVLGEALMERCLLSSKS